MQPNKCTPVNFSEHLALLIRERGITQKQLAADIDVSQSTIVKWLKGTAPFGERLNRAAEYFGLHPDFLLNPIKYNDPFTIANAAAALKETKEEKQEEFERVLRIETDKLKARKQGWKDAESSIQEEPAEYRAVDWRRRALSAERKLEKLRLILAETPNQD